MQPCQQLPAVVQFVYFTMAYATRALILRPQFVILKTLQGFWLMIDRIDHSDHPSSSNNNDIFLPEIMTFDLF